MTIADAKWVGLGSQRSGILRALVLLFLASCANAGIAQTIQIKLLDGKTGRPITYSSLTSLRTVLQIWPGQEGDLTLLIPADKHGTARLRLTHDDSEINVPERVGMRAESKKLLTNRNKRDRDEFDKKFKSCTAFELADPIVRFVDSISIGPIVRTLGGKNYFRYISCAVDTSKVLSTKEVLQQGVVTANNCGTATASPQPGQVILFVRSPTNQEAWRQVN